ncbi:hypothetical protein [Ruegeria intermedia]|uniref:hypothetical protein n=1 Tax=Ruegeria intermedia TaxID=996115 RepID=UPI00122CCBA8|nr:hypothetical protein [Ruegeria intermedia]
MPDDIETKRFLECAKDYSPIGYFISEVSAFELEMDKFIFEFARRNNELARKLTSRFPKKATLVGEEPERETTKKKKTKTKVEFVVEACWTTPRLRTVPMFRDGFLCFNFFCYAAEEIFDVRNHVAHGSIDAIILEGTRSGFWASKLKTDGKTASVQRYRYTVGLLAELTGNASALRKYCFRLRDVLVGKSSAEQVYQDEKKEIETRRYLVSQNLLSPLMKGFLAGGVEGNG